MIVMASRQFALVDGTSIFVFSYDGRLLCQPKYTSLRTDSLNANALSISNDTIAIKDKSEEDSNVSAANKGPTASWDKLMEKRSQVKLDFGSTY
jgi:hypothetical protein